MSDNDDQKIRMVHSSNEGNSNVIPVNSKNAKEVSSLIDYLDLERESISALLTAVVYKDGMSMVYMTPMSGGSMAYLSKQVEAEFMSTFMFPEEE